MPGFINIISDDSEHVLALAQLAQHTELPDNIRDRLYQFSINRPNFIESREVFSGLAAQRLKASNSNDLSHFILNSMSNFSTDYYRKHVEAEIGVQQILMLNVDERNKTINQIREMWEKENEPDVKMSLADILLRSK